MEETAGQLVRAFRRRAGLTQAELGRRLDPPKVQSAISDIENDVAPLDSVALINSLARVLGVHPADLTGQPYRVGLTPSEDRGHAAVAEIRRQIERYDLDPEWDGPARSVSELADAVAQCTALRQGALYGRLAERMSPLLAELQAASALYAGQERDELFRLRAVAYREADAAAHALGYLDLSILATERVRWAAALSGSALQVGIGEYLRARQLWESASWPDALSVLDRAVDTLQSSGQASTPAGISVIGSIHLRAAITAARKYDADEAWTRYDEAKGCLDRLGDDPPDYCKLVFTRGNIEIHGPAIAVELGDGAQAVRRGTGLRVDPKLPKSRAGHYHLDMARGWLWYGDRERSLAALEKADRTAPALIRHHPMAQALVRSLRDAEQRSMSQRIRTMASKLHV